MNHPLLSLLFLCAMSLPVSAADKKVVAFAQDAMANDFRRAQVNEARDAAARHQEVQFVFSDAQGQVSMLIKQIEQFTEQKVDLLILGTNDEAAVVPAVAKAYQAGIPVIILDRGIKGDQYTTFINSDNVKIGALGALEIATRLNGKGTVLLFEGLPKADVTQLRTEGFLAGIGKYKNIKVIRRVGNYLRKDAIAEMEKLVAEGVHIDAIFAESDSMLSGARMVLEKKGIDVRKMVTIGCDYTSEAREAIRNGTQTGSVLFPLGGNQSIETARKLFAGESVPKHIVIPVKMVTKANVDDVAPIF